MHGQFEVDTLKHYDPGNPTHLIIAYELASQSLRVMRNKLATGFNVAPIRSDYQAIQSRLDVYQRIGEYNLNGASLSRMNDLISIFDRQLANLEGWQESLMEITKELSDYRIELIKHKDRLTIDQTGVDELQQQYYNTRHLPLINEADSLYALVELKLEEILELEFNISKDYAQVYNRIQDLKVYTRLYWDNMMGKEEISWIIRDENKSTGDQFSNTLWRITDFFKVNIPRVFYLILIFIGTIFLLKYIRREDQRNPEEERQPLLYNQPVSISFLLTGMLFPLVFPPTTSLMYDFALLVSYIPFLLILRSSLDPKRFRTYVLFFIFLVILKVQSVYSGSSGYFAIIMVVSGSAFIYTIFPQTLRRHFQIRWKWVSIFNWLLCGLVVLGVVCILAQRIRLGGIIINGVGETIAIALILLYFANWFDQLINFLRIKSFAKNLASNRERMAEFWLTWSNRAYFILLLIFLVSFLKNFSLYTSAKDGIIEFFNSTRELGELAFTYGGIALFLVVLYGSSKLSSTIKFLAEDKSYYKSRKETANIAVIIRFFLVTVGFILALLVSGIPIDRVTIILGALSVGIGFGLQNVVNNLISGIILIFERPIQTGDLVELQQYTGFVKDIGIRSSVIRTYDGAEVIVPNGNLVSQEVINWTLSNRQRRVEIRVGVAYGSNVDEVTSVLNGVLTAHEKVLKYPAPAVLLDGFGDNSVDFRLLIWTSDIDNWLITRSELSANIYNALDEAGIGIPFPQRDLHITSWKTEVTPSKITDAVKNKASKDQDSTSGVDNSTAGQDDDGN